MVRSKADHRLGGLESGPYLSISTFATVMVLADVKPQSFISRFGRFVPRFRAPYQIRSSFLFSSSYPLRRT